MNGSEVDATLAKSLYPRMSAPFDAGSTHETVAETVLSRSFATTLILVGADGCAGIEATVNVHFGESSDSPIELDAEILTSTRTPVLKLPFDQFSCAMSVISS